MWFCTMVLDLLLDSVCWRGPRSSWSLSPAGLRRSSLRGSPTATRPSGRPDRLPSSSGLPVPASTGRGNQKFLAPLPTGVVTRHRLETHRNPKMRRDTKMASPPPRTRRSSARGACSFREEVCRRRRYPNRSGTRSRCTGSTCTRGPSG